MRKEVVPIDMASEQKELMGLVSKRQVLYLLLGGYAIYSYAPKVFPLAGNWMVGVILTIVSILPTAVVIGLLAFYKIEKHHMYLDRYLLTKLQYKHQLGNWSKYKKNLIEKDEMY